MKFAPKTDAEVKQDSEKLWDAGMYDFEVLNGTDKTSKAGNEMIQLRIKIFSSEGEEKIIYDYLMESIGYKLRHACEAMGLLGKYEGGELVGGDFEGCTGRLKLRVGKPQEGYATKNEVGDYLVPSESVTAADPKPKAKARAGKKDRDLDDEIPWA